MDKKSRVKACMDRQEVDRPPFAVWRHFTETQGRECVAAHRRVFEETDVDILKLMADGFRDISDGQVVARPEDWDRIRVPQPGDMFFTQQIDRICWGVEAIEDCAPVYHSVFSPYTLLHLAWGKELVDAHLKDEQARKHIMPVLHELTQSLAQGIREEIRQYTRQLIKQMGTRGFMLGGGGGYASTLRSEAVRWIGEVLKE
ncbi:MAG: hypothetical protein K2P41_03855 [Lachnospiraceae bacterium]|nr:hypothetical protein [Lachnospiraceae bacterium]